MQGITEAGGAITVYTVSDWAPGLIMVGTKASVPKIKKSYTMKAIPLTPIEARSMANWLNGAADAAEKQLKENNV